MTSAAQLTIAATGALASILIARILGPSGSGSYFVAQTVVLLGTTLSTLGTENGIVYYVSRGEWSPRRGFSASLGMALVLGLVAAVAVLILRAAVPSAFAGLSVSLTAAVAASVPFALVSLYAAFTALAMDRYEAYAGLPLAQAILTLGLAVAGAGLLDLSGAVVGLAISMVVVGVGAVVWGLARLPRGGPQPPGQLRRAISFGSRAYASNALQLVNYRLDVFVLAAVASTAAVGQYAVAVAITSVLFLLPRSLAGVLLPRVAYLDSQGDDHGSPLELVEAKALRHATIVIVTVGIGLALALILLVVPVYGASFRPAIAPGLILLPGVVAVAIAGVLSATITGRGRPQYSLYTALMTMPVTVMLYLVLIPAYEMTGAALSSTISYAMTLLVTAGFYRRTTGRGVGPLLIPTRSELEDLLHMPSAALTWRRRSRQ